MLSGSSGCLVYGVLHFHWSMLGVDVKWATLYAEWIDERQQFEVPKVFKHSKVDVVAIKSMQL